MSSLLIAVLAGLAPTIAVIVNVVLTRRTKKITASNAGALADIHILVNSRLTQALDRIAGLERALGISPDDPVPHVTGRDGL